MSFERAETIPQNKALLASGNFPAIPLLAQAEVLYERDGGLHECFVPVTLIDHEEVPVKEEWAESLARQMRQKANDRGGTGQQTPIRLGWIEGENKFRIIDGFHRDAALVHNGETTIYATVERTDWDTLYDDRIFTAKDHAHVRFSRVVKWIQEVWEHSGINTEMSVEQAILLYRYDNNGTKLGVDSETVQVAKDWVARKEKQWDTTAMTIHGYLQTAESVDPLLVNATRDKKSGHALIAPTQQIIKMFSDNLPNEFALQHAVWKEAKAHNLKGPQVKALCLLVKGKDEAEAQTILNETDAANIEPAYAETKGRQLRRAADPRYKGATALKTARIEIGRVNERVQLSLDRGEEVDADMLKNLDETVREARALQTQLGSLATKVAALKANNQQRSPDIAEPLEDKRRVERDYKRHSEQTVQNKGRTPQPRLRISALAMDLPTFGRLSAEDWGSIEPHHRFAISLDHPDMATLKFDTGFASLVHALELSSLPEEKRRQDSPSAIKAEVHRLANLLTRDSPRLVGPVIKLDKAANRIALTDKGSEYLTDVTKNALLLIDDSR